MLISLIASSQQLTLQPIKIVDDSLLCWNKPQATFMLEKVLEHDVFEQKLILSDSTRLILSTQVNTLEKQKNTLKQKNSRKTNVILLLSSIVILETVVIVLF